MLARSLFVPFLSALVLSLSQCSRDASAEVARPSTPGPVVVALYTSEGCSSCPPADQALTSLASAAREDGVSVIPLSFHVDYWNYIGWADPYSTAENSRRQQQLARALGSRVYTPQAFVDGRTELVGSDRNGMDERIKEAARAPKSPVVLGSRTEGKTVIVDVSSPALASGTEVVVALTQARAEVTVTRGENSGKRLVHTNVVRALSVTSGVAGGAAHVKLAIPDGMPRDGARVVAFVEDASTMRVLGAATQSL